MSALDQFSNDLVYLERLYRRVRVVILNSPQRCILPKNGALISKNIIENLHSGYLSLLGKPQDIAVSPGLYHSQQFFGFSAPIIPYNQGITRSNRRSPIYTAFLTVESGD
jgi:hypothetical protein